MVKILVKKGNENEFLYELPIDTPMEKVYTEIFTIFNARIKIKNLCYELGQLALHGPVMPIPMQGLAPEQIAELGLRDDFAEQLGDDWVSVPDPIGRRCGRQPPSNLQKVLNVAIEEAKQAIDKCNADAGLPLNLECISEQLHRLRGAVLVLLPDGLPDHDPAHLDQSECFNPSSIDTSHRDMIGSEGCLWFCSRELPRDGKLSAALKTSNDKTKVTVKVTDSAKAGAPAREPAIGEQERLQLMAHFRRKQEELEVQYILTFLNKY